MGLEAWNYFWGPLLSPPPAVVPPQLAVPRHHPKTKRTKTIPPPGNRGASPFTCCLCNFTSLRSCSTSIFSFSFSGRSSTCRAGILAPDPGVAVERREVLAHQGASPKNCGARAPRPPAPAGTASRARGAHGAERSPASGQPLAPALPGVPDLRPPGPSLSGPTAPGLLQGAREGSAGKAARGLETLRGAGPPAGMLAGGLAAGPATPAGHQPGLRPKRWSWVS